MRRAAIIGAEGCALLMRYLPHAIRQFGGARSGVAAVEFALLLPFLVILYFGMVELSRGFYASRKLTFVARDIADLASRQTGTLNNSASDSTNVNTIFGAAASVFYPFSSPAMALTSIVFKTGTDGKVHAYTDWSVQSNGGTVRPCGELAAGNTPPAVPAALFVANTTVIAADVSYNYTPIVGSTFMAIGSSGGKVGSGSVTSIAMQQTSYMQPRAVNRLFYNGSVGSCSPSP